MRSTMTSPSENDEVKRLLSGMVNSKRLRVLPAMLHALLLLLFAAPAAAQPVPPVSASQSTLKASVVELLWALPRAPLGAHCAGRVVCTDLGTWGAHARLTGSTLIQPDRSVPGGLLTPAASLTLGGWGEVGIHFPILLGPLGTDPLPLPPRLFAKGAFTPPFRGGSHGILFATLTIPDGPFAALDENGQPMARRYEVGAALSGPLLWVIHYGLSVSGQFSPGGPASRLEAGLELRARFDGFHVFAQPTYSASFCEHGSPSGDCQSSAAVLVGFQIPFTAGHASAAGGPSRGIGGQEGIVIEATLGMSYDEATRAKYGDGIGKVEKLWERLFTSVIDPYLDEGCMLWDDDHAPMVDLGRKSVDGLYCERDGLRAPIGTHFDRNKGNTRVCYDAGLRNCILRRGSEKELWRVVPIEQQARRPYLKDDCHVYEAGAKLPLQQVGFRSDDGQACLWRGYRFPIGTEFWAVPGDDVLCEDATLKRCSIELPPRPMNAAQYVSSRAGQGLVHGVTNLVEKFERGPRVAADLASGRLHVQTIAGEAYEALKDKLGHVTLDDAKAVAIAVVEAGKEKLGSPAPQLLGDLAEAMGELPAKLLENEMTAGLGNLAGGATGAARTGAKVEKALTKAERKALKAERAVADAAKVGRTSGRVDAAVADHITPPHIPTPPTTPNVVEKLPEHRLSAPPKKRGHSPRGDDGHPVELHHTTQNPDGPVAETTRTDHRIGPNFQQNHANTGQAPSQINRAEWRKQQKTYWQQEWDKGRFNGNKQSE